MKINLDYDFGSWIKFYGFLRRGEVDYESFLQKISLVESKNGEDIKFGLLYTIFKEGEKYYGKMVFGLFDDKNLKKETKEEFKKNLKTFFEKVKDKSYNKESSIVNYDIKYSDSDLEKTNCLILIFFLEKYSETIVYERSFREIINFFYNDFFKISRDEITIQIDEPKRKNGENFLEENIYDGFTDGLPDWLGNKKTLSKKLCFNDLPKIILNKDLEKEIDIISNRFKNKEHFEKWNADLPRGIILYGPPGTGKTTIAKYLSNKLKLNFLNISIGDYNAKWAGETLQNLSQELKNIKENSLVFIDEIDSILPNRKKVSKYGGSVSQEKVEIVNTFLEYMDGLKAIKNVLFIGATNNLDEIDPSALRAGRFNIKLFIGFPDSEARKKLWKIYLEKAQENISFKIFDENMNFDYLSEITNRFTGADIKEITRRILNDFAIGTLSSSSIEINPDITFKGLLHNIEKYKEEISTNKGIIPEKEKLFLKDIGGQEKLKEEIRKIILQIKNKQFFDEMGVSMPKGLLMYGPPGTGKTLSAKVIANETGVLFYMLTAKDFMGQGGVEELEKKFSEFQSPSIVFIDEIDAIGQNRKLSSSYEIKVLNTLLQKMDGFTEKEDIFFIGATNNLEMLDEALLRAGRFDLKIHIDLPDDKAREDIFNIYLNKAISKKGESHFEENINLKEIIDETNGFVGADIKEVIRRLSQNLVIEMIESGFNIKKKYSSKEILEEIKEYKKEKNIGSSKKIGFGL